MAMEADEYLYEPKIPNFIGFKYAVNLEVYQSVADNNGLDYIEDCEYYHY